MRCLKALLGAQCLVPIHHFYSQSLLASNSLDAECESRSSSEIAADNWKVIPFLCEAAPNLLISYFFLAYLALLAVRFLFLAL